jgi:hypothetical protein
MAFLSPGLRRHLQREPGVSTTVGAAPGYGVPDEHVQVFIAEFDHEHWAKAGVLAADAAA